MRTEGFKGALLSASIITSLMVPVVATTLILSANPVSASPRIYLSAFTTKTPTIDGVINSEEWQDAAVSTGMEWGYEITLFVMNDMENLYVAVRVSDFLKGTPDDYLWVIFDHDHDNVLENGEDALRIYERGDPCFSDWFCERHNGWGGWGTDVTDVGHKGTNDGSGATVSTNGFREYELSHPLDSADDPHDFSLKAGDTVGFTLEIDDFDVDIGRGKNVGWPTELIDGVFTGPPGDIMIASPPLSISISPDTLNLRSRGRWITCFIELPEGYDVADIDVSTVRLHVDENNVPAEPRPMGIGGHKLMVKFSRPAVQAIVSVGEVELKITGLIDSIPFEGSDTIRVIKPGKGNG
ncbi:hypothetical protein ES703_03818 [subsurface metagenome]